MLTKINQLLKTHQQVTVINKCTGEVVQFNQQHNKRYINKVLLLMFSENCRLYGNSNHNDFIIKGGDK